jgi:hypothetical protein
MTQLAPLLRKSADEIRTFSRVSPHAGAFGNDWLEMLACRLEVAAELGSDSAVEREVDAIAYSMIDSGPPSRDCSPSFSLALDALQRKRKKLGR